MAVELLISDVMLKQRSALHGNVDPQMIRADMLFAQDAFIKPALGTALFNKLLAMVKDSSIYQSDNADYKKLIDDYILDALMYYILSKLPITMGYQFWNVGVAKTSREGVETPSQSELESIANEYMQRAEFYKNGLNLYLRQNASAKYPEYLHPGTGADTVYPDRTAFTLPIYLGGEDDYRCCKGRYY